jgi:catechol 2,3-dioxygenase
MMIDPQTRMGPVTLRVRDLAETSRFYAQAIGLTVREASSHSVELGTGAQPLVRLQSLTNGRFYSHRTGLYHLALRVPSRQALANWLYHYVQQQTPHWQGASDHGVSEALYLSDPEGNGIEIYRDRPNQEWETLANGHIPAVANPLNLQGLLEQAKPGAWRGLPQTTDMGHVHLKVKNIAAARHFYHHLLGFEIKTQFQNSALFVSAGGYHHHLGLNIWHSDGAPALPEDGFGLAEYSILFAHNVARSAAISRLKSADWPLQAENGDPTVRDPSGIQLRLQVAAPPDPLHSGA